MSAIDDYKKLSANTLDELEMFRRSQGSLRIESTGHQLPPAGVRDAAQELIRSAEFAALYVAVCNKKLDSAFRRAKAEAEGFSARMPATVESLKLEQVKAVEMQESTAES